MNLSVLGSVPAHRCAAWAERGLAAVALVALLGSGCSANPFRTLHQSTPVPPPARVAVVVPMVVGLQGDYARGAVAASGFTVSWSEPVPIVSAFVVTAQEPDGGEIVAPDATIHLTVRSIRVPERAF